MLVIHDHIFLTAEEPVWLFAPGKELLLEFKRTLERENF